MAEQICTRCVMDSSDPGIEFDENGVCSACKQYMHNRELSGYHPGESEKKLQETVVMMKENSKDSDYDCVLGISGGVDSAYTVSSLVEKGFLEESGRLEVPGRPALFRTTDQFLRVFGLTSLAELTPLPTEGEDGQLKLPNPELEALANQPENAASEDA